MHQLPVMFQMGQNTERVSADEIGFPFSLFAPAGVPFSLTGPLIGIMDPGAQGARAYGYVVLWSFPMLQYDSPNG